MKHARPEGSNPAAQEHVAQLRNRRVGQNLFDVRLNNRNGRRKKSRHSARDRNHMHRVGRQREHKVQASQHVDAGSHHGRSVDEC